jgi:Sugar transport protein
MMGAIAISYLGAAPLWRELMTAHDVLFWLMLGGFIWVIGDVFQQYAAKYVGISRGIPLSNTNQLWGLLWGMFVFGELHGSGTSTHMQVIGGSLLMMLGVGAIAFSAAQDEEQRQWTEAARRECQRYRLATDHVQARMLGTRLADEAKPSRGVLDWLLVAVATIIFMAFATIARVPRLLVNRVAVLVLSAATLLLLLFSGLTLWRTTRFY